MDSEQTVLQQLCMTQFAAALTPSGTAALRTRAVHFQLTSESPCRESLNTGDMESLM